jgi:hypothetical protein
MQIKGSNQSTFQVSEALYMKESKKVKALTVRIPEKTYRRARFVIKFKQDRTFQSFLLEKICEAANQCPEVKA